MARKEKSLPFNGMAARRTLYLMAQEMTDNQCIYLTELANNVLFGGQFNAQNTTNKDRLISSILSGLESCHSEVWLDLIVKILSKVADQEKGQAVI